MLSYQFLREVLPALQRRTPLFNQSLDVLVSHAQLLSLFYVCCTRLIVWDPRLA